MPRRGGSLNAQQRQHAKRYLDGLNLGLTGASLSVPIPRLPCSPVRTSKKKKKKKKKKAKEKIKRHNKDTKTKALEKSMGSNTNESDSPTVLRVSGPDGIGDTAENNSEDVVEPMPIPKPPAGIKRSTRSRFRGRPSGSARRLVQGEQNNGVNTKVDKDKEVSDELLRMLDRHQRRTSDGKKGDIEDTWAAVRHFLRLVDTAGHGESSGPASVVSKEEREEERKQILNLIPKFTPDDRTSASASDENSFLSLLDGLLQCQGPVIPDNIEENAQGVSLERVEVDGSAELESIRAVLGPVPPVYTGDRAKDLLFRLYRRSNLRYPGRPPTARTVYMEKCQRIGLQPEPMGVVRNKFSPECQSQ